MRDPDVVEAELADIAAIQDDVTKAERIVAWAAMHPSEIRFAINLFRGRTDSLHHWATHNEPFENSSSSNTQTDSGTSI